LLIYLSVNQSDLLVHHGIEITHEPPVFPRVSLLLQRHVCLHIDLLMRGQGEIVVVQMAQMLIRKYPGRF
jgi:hypothetical protein